MGYGLELGLVGRDRHERMEEKYRRAEEEIRRLKKTSVPPSARLNAILEGRGTTPVSTGVPLIELLRRPQLDYAVLAEVDPGRPDLPPEVAEQVEINVKYEGYIRRGLKEAEEQKRLENRLLPEDLDYMSIRLLRVEARQKLAAVRPRTLGQAGRISGVSPADIGGLMVYLGSLEDKKNV